ncbi:HAD-superfamily hydrolase, subfamily IIA [Hyphomicrobium denitrificans ATCC 51888]|uniref:HAD-superfamily hydrolase, subfamily IIA n=1 Tax=Hyphomicrobium denitrificans (strain ATCC 51888 / DSM 1869 / NCIMB 11706 / TK 0415) TaxID=582899 RepID=D8JSG3_HYPDA|nr:TIGR01459 family HAD-type hydrolase [Hyphomicrobium denitrificans]ADJ24257.1 HAD-superfamily hydrolase, subfamily IIA [Hyphomicrobium denitrificans ATCC 51888]
MTAIPVLQSIAPLAATADLWFVDIWGVMHNGVRPYASSVAACEAFRQQGGTILLVTNSPRPRESVARQLDGIGVARSAYDGIVSSGDVSRSLIEDWAGEPILHIGPERDLPVFANLQATPGAGVADAVVAVCTGLYDDEKETPADYAEMLAKLKARDIPMICANPDQKVERDGRLIYCAGAIARAYKALGGIVSYAGKPFQPIYDLALEIGSDTRGKSIAKDRVLAIGDGVSTDIAGASNFGIRSVFIASGVDVNANENVGAAAARLFANSSAQPIAVMNGFNW